MLGSALSLATVLWRSDLDVDFVYESPPPQLGICICDAAGPNSGHSNASWSLVYAGSPTDPGCFGVHVTGRLLGANAYLDFVRLVSRTGMVLLGAIFESASRSVYHDLPGSG